MNKQKTESKSNISCELCSASSLCASLPELNAILNSDEFVHKRQFFNKNEQIIAANQTLTHYYVIHSGAAKAYIIEDGAEKIINFYFPGEIIGIESLNGNKLDHFVGTLTQSEICLIDYDKLNYLIEHNEPVNRLILQLMSNKIIQQQQMLLTYAKKRADEKIATFIYLIYQKSSDNHSFSLDMSRLEIANFLDLTIETVSRTISKLVSLNIITAKGRSLSILDPIALKEFK